MLHYGFEPAVASLLLSTTRDPSRLPASFDPPTPAVPCLQGATGPVHAVLSENMAAYHFWSVDAHRWQVAAIELYDASPTTMRCAAAGGLSAAAAVHARLIRCCCCACWPGPLLLLCMLA